MKPPSPEQIEAERLAQQQKLEEWREKACELKGKGR